MWKFDSRTGAWENCPTELIFFELIFYLDVRRKKKYKSLSFAPGWANEDGSRLLVLDVLWCVVLCVHVLCASLEGRFRDLRVIFLLSVSRSCDAMGR